MIIDSENFSKFSKQKTENIRIEIKDVKAEYRMQETKRLLHISFCAAVAFFSELDRGLGCR